MDTYDKHLPGGKTASVDQYVVESQTKNNDDDGPSKIVILPKIVVLAQSPEDAIRQVRWAWGLDVQEGDFRATRLPWKLHEGA